MRLLALTLLLFTLSCKEKKPSLATAEQLRKEKAAAFLDPSQSPLDENELSTFGGLHFYGIDENYRVKGMLHRTPGLPFFDMPHSNNKTFSYQKYGDVTFILNGRGFSLPVYSNSEFRKEHILFLPFTDLTNAKETYGGGRYMDLSYTDQSDEVELDFNLCYQPYCAYSHRYSCPIVPAENHIDMEIRAGEKN